MLPAWIGLNLADAILTLIGFFSGGMESNLFLGGVASTWGLERMLLIKVLLSVAIGGAIWQRRAYSMMKILNVGMLAVVLYNAVIITYTLS